ncbi:FliA/WhiG family RNA polymerase sigma factor [Heyndrickxia sp. FSL K6-6286]|jgi:RNA polymerase sigma factor for flagellar operon FliA|uniref:FliA/WhiG family RNA polymerase sigma factor n=1 Tax=Heyndrickxia oleronia TaxID=38875 RepID=A0AAW6SWH3_9BACI|nr:FliA/WhiG family RNA polymerase sigma factor [Heyndrickxia oleronia]NYV67034.1 FliA/WhiG family RNA polymerase sigma factor [Bacillus sp. Gen3]OJH18075.1 RNA polymerase subunit sigma [Bacillus obstructivus]MBU5211138.1 FliA/WhiG family RNA polymerase sigma factor [Heyndrickxia oleronia]MCM3237699.1 FliA/WhiG family RNA polymerase sigma factor [Heyndrickxia oleronia]MDH5161217.1 FliA/WhiG family RNA polymerase sigma factor [Heyndrickxia oleronia]
MLYKEATEEKKYWDLWLHSRDTHAGDVLVKKYLPLVQYHVHRIAVGLPRSVSKDDLKSLGMLGLLDALNKFDATRDLKFDTYASFRIRGAILDGLRKEDWLPRGTRERAKKIEMATELLEQEYMRPVTAEEIANHMGLSEEEVCQTVNEHFFANVLSMDEHVNEMDDSEMQGFILKDEKAPNPEELLVKGEQIKELSKVITQLSEKEQLVLSLFYHEELTLTEIGEIMGLSTSRISQIHSKALFKLKNILEKQL